MAGLRFDVVSIFPEVFEPVFRAGVVGRGIRRGLLSVHAHDLRDHAADRRQVDDEPFGGGPGMVLKPEPVFAAIESVRPYNPGPVILMEPWGEPLTQRLANELAAEPGLIVICGRYEGVDDRVREVLADREVSIGDYVLSGGEIPAMVLIDAVARLVPGVVGDRASLAQDLFAQAGQGLAEEAAAAEEGGAAGYPQFTRPAEWQGHRVPEVLLSGDHGAISRWRRANSRTRQTSCTEKLR